MHMHTYVRFTGAQIQIIPLTNVCMVKMSFYFAPRPKKIHYEIYDIPNIQKRLYRHYRRQVELIGTFEHKKRPPMRDITLEHYQRALQALKDKGYAPNTLDGYHTTGGMIFREAVKRGLIRRDPTAHAYVPRDQMTVAELEQEGIPKYLERDELQKFLDIAKNQGLKMDYAIFMTLAYTGMRVGELCALKWSDIDVEDRTIHITKTLYNPSNKTKEYTLLTPKTKRSRTIDVSDTLFSVLQQHRAQQRKAKMQFRQDWHEADFVFARHNIEYAGYPQFTKTIHNRMRRLLKLAGLRESLTPHSLRHTCTSLSAEAGIPLEDIQAQLGHKNDSTTRNIYLHMTKSRKKKTAQQFEQFMQQNL
jgi:integrase